MDAATLISNIISQSGTDASRATVLSLLNESYGTQLTRSRWLKEVTSLGNTVAGTSDYTVPDGVVEILGLRVGAYEFDPVSIEEMWSLSSQTGSWNGRDGVFAPNYSSTGGTTVTLYPTPTVNGTAITVLSPMIGGDLTDSGGSVPVTPSDTHGSLIDGTTALVLLRVDERPDLAQSFQARFDSATEELRRRKNGRVGGPIQAKIAGIHFSI